MTYLSVEPIPRQSPFTLSIKYGCLDRILGRGSSDTGRSSRLLGGSGPENISVTFARYLGRTLTLEISATFLGVIKLEERDAGGTGTAAGGEIIGLSRSPDWIIPSA
jgi:hypothetical protein